MNLYKIHKDFISNPIYEIRTKREREYLRAIARKLKINMVKNGKIKIPFFVTFEQKKAVDEEYEDININNFILSKTRDSFCISPLRNLEDDAMIFFHFEMIKKYAQLHFISYGINGIAETDVFVTKDGRYIQVGGNKNNPLVELRDPSFFKLSTKTINYDSDYLNYIDQEKYIRTRLVNNVQGSY